ncbi:hypothetical protein TcasGA2_TC011906 [Tribolium castaneum]|uniref:Uncharacterized protein n=1 Tax=Tribolium castaneum TaxID=7070 RepID=D6X3D6_TRICA|nr:hypothetical protein TcasGA2_TC011906 [Tribolium castaneum]
MNALGFRIRELSHRNATITLDAARHTKYKIFTRFFGRISSGKSTFCPTGPQIFSLSCFLLFLAWIMRIPRPRLRRRTFRVKKYFQYLRTSKGPVQVQLTKLDVSRHRHQLGLRETTKFLAEVIRQRNYLLLKQGSRLSLLLVCYKFRRPWWKSSITF